MIALDPAPLDPAERRRRIVDRVNRLRAHGHEVEGDTRRYLAGQVIALAAEDLAELCALLAAARWSGPAVVA